MFLAITIAFSQTKYSVDENSGTAQLALVLSNASSIGFTTQVLDTNGLATGKY